jgi:glycosyltransferase involved in cell wall biosynthesis
MTIRPNITVIVTTYNHETYIGACIDSILSQTLSADRIIACLDKSDDQTERILRSYANDKIEIVAQESRVGPFWNTYSGLSRVAEGIVCFIDGDDVWASTQKLQIVLREFEANERLVLLSHDHIRVSNSLIPIGVTDLTHRAINRIKNLPLQQRMEEIWFAAMTKRFWFGSAYSVYLDRTDLSGFLNIVRQREECAVAYFDLVFGPYVALKSGKGSVAYIDGISFLYRLHNRGSGSSKTTADQILNIERLAATDRLAFHVLEASAAPKNVLDRYRSYRDEYNYLTCIYRGQICRGVKSLTGIRTLLMSEGRLAKEIVRIVTIAIFKPKGFLALRRLYQTLVS